MPMSLSRANARISELMKLQVKQPVGMALGEVDRLQQELESLSEETLALRMEIARLIQDNQDLRESAKIWIRLYDAQLARANRAVAELAAVSGKDATDLKPDAGFDPQEVTRLPAGRFKGKSLPN